MTLTGLRESAVMSVEQVNKKHYRLSLADGRQLELAVVDMFNVHVLLAGQALVRATFQPLSSLNNIEMQPIYKLASFESGEGVRLDGRQPLLDSICAVYAYYTHGTIRPWRQALK